MGSLRKKYERIGIIYLYRWLCLAEADETVVNPMKDIWVSNDTWQVFINSALPKF